MRELEVVDGLTLPGVEAAYVLFQHDSVSSEDTAIGVFLAKDMAEGVQQGLHEYFPDYDGEYFVLLVPFCPTAQQLISELWEDE